MILYQSGHWECIKTFEISVLISRLVFGLLKLRYLIWDWYQKVNKCNPFIETGMKTHTFGGILVIETLARVSAHLWSYIRQEETWRLFIELLVSTFKLNPRFWGFLYESSVPDFLPMTSNSCGCPIKTTSDIVWTPPSLEHVPLHYLE